MFCVPRVAFTCREFVLCVFSIWTLLLAGRQTCAECIAFDYTVRNVSCSGVGDGGASVLVTAGTGPFTYSWAPINQTSANVTGLATGNYTLTIHDSSGCNVTEYIVIYGPSPVVALVYRVVPPSCNGKADGIATILVHGGKGPYTYVWEKNETYNQLLQGTHEMFVMDSNGCKSDNVSFTIEDAPAITVTLEASLVTCKRRADAALTITATGGKSPYIYQNGNGQTSPPTTSNFTFNSLKATRKQEALLITIYDDSINSLLFQDWSWAQTRTMRSPLLPHTGVFSIGYVPANYNALYFHCVVPQCLDTETYAGISFWVNGAAGGQMFQFSVSDEFETEFGTRNFYGLENRTAVLPPNTWIQFFFDFSWVQDGTYSGFRLQDLSGLYTNNVAFFDDIYLIPQKIEYPFVTVTDANGCKELVNYTIDTIPAMEVSVSIVSSACFGDYGTLQASVTNGGVGPYSYLWIPSYETNDTIDKVNATVSFKSVIIYSDKVEDPFTEYSIGASSVVNYAIFFRNSASIQFSPKHGSIIIASPKELCANISQCFGIEFWVYTTSGRYDNITLAIASYTLATTYIYTNARVLLSQLVTVPTIPPYQWVKAFYDFSSLDRDTAYNAIWFEGDQTQDDIYLDEIVIILKSPENKEYDPYLFDYYRVEVTDANNCTALYDTIKVDQPLELTVEVSSNFVTCQGFDNGILTAEVNGGTSPYQYNWTVVPEKEKVMTFHNSSVVKWQSPSYGYVQIKDAKGCSVTSSNVWIRQPPAMTYSYTSTPATCQGRNDGTITFTAQGGTPPYTLTLSPNFAATYLNLLPVYIFGESLESPFRNATLPASGNLRDSSVVAQSGYYSISFVPGNFEGISMHCDGCIDTRDYLGISFWVYVGETQSLSLLPVLQFGVKTGMDITKFGASDPVPGVFMAPNFTGVWTEVIYDLDMNSSVPWDTFYIKDSSGANSTTKLYIDSIEFIPRWYSTRPDSVNVPSGFQGTFKGGAAYYRVIVTDQNDCRLSTNVSILQPDVLQLNFTLKSPSSKFSTDGEITAVISGGVPPYIYTWGQLAQYGPKATQLMVGSYYLEVKDGNGCSTIQTVVLSSDGLSIINSSFAVTVALSAAIACCALIGVMALVALIIKPECYSDKTPLFCRIIHVGVLIAYTAAVVTLPEPTDKLCLAFPWLVGVSFTLVYGCLFLKTWRIFWILRASKKLSKVSLSNFYICRLLALYFLFELMYLIAWTIVDPPKAQLVSLVNDEQQLRCTSEHWGLLWAIFIGYKFLWMLFGAMMAIGSRYIYERFNESKQIYYCIYNAVTVSIVSVPLMLVLNNIPFALTIIEVVYILLIFTFTLVSLFFNVWMKMIFGEEEELSTMRKRNYGPPPPIEMEANKKNSQGSKVSKKSGESSTSSFMTTTGTMPTIITSNSTPPNMAVEMSPPRTSIIP